MALYKSNPAIAHGSAEAVYTKLSNLKSLQSVLGQIPGDALSDEDRKMLESISVTEDSISFPAGPVGDITLRLSRMVEPTLISLEGVGTPVAITLTLEIAPISGESCEVATAIDLAIPAMLKPMVGGSIQKMANQFTEVIASLKYS